MQLVNSWRKFISVALVGLTIKIDGDAGARVASNLSRDID